MSRPSPMPTKYSKGWSIWSKNSIGWHFGFKMHMTEIRGVIALHLNS